MELVGKILGNRYEILEEIGIGGMATVYKARCKLLNRFVAIKVLKNEYARDAEFVKRFKAEAQSAASLAHPNIVSVYDVGEDLGINYIVMELLDGDTLKDLINKKGKLGNEVTLKYASQVASALEAAHTAKIIHRDIKPQNIVLTANNIAKVTDFGIAKVSSRDTISSNSNTIGSVHYFSPEHAKGGYTDEKSDIYSLGVVMYEMATGKLPFNADTPVSVALKQIQEEPKAPREIDDTVSIPLNNIIMKAMAKNTSQRYQTASEMLDDIFSAMNNVNNTHILEDNKQVISGPWERENSKSDVLLGGRKSNRENSKKNKTIFAILVAIACVALIALGVLTANLIKTISSKRISELENKITNAPQLVGKAYEEVKVYYEDKGLEINVQKYVKNAEYEAGIIISQDVLEGQEIPNNKISVIVSNGPEMIKMIDVIGKDYTVAKYELEALGFKVEQTMIVDEKTASNTILKQNIEKDKMVPNGTKVTLEVSKGNGKTMVIVPNVLGEDQVKAIATLQKLKLSVKINETTEASKNDGEVLAQSLKENQEVEEGSLIELTVNKLPRNKTVTIDMTSLTSQIEATNIAVKITAMVDGVTSTVFNQTKSAPYTNFNIELTGYSSAKIYVYFDDKMVSEQSVTF